MYKLHSDKGRVTMSNVAVTAKGK